MSNNLVDKLKEGAKWYGNAIKENYKQLAPALIISTLSVYIGQETIGMIHNPPELLVQLGGYGSSIIGGYGTFLPLEYRNHKEKYPHGFFSKEIGKTLIDVLSADYLSDIISYSPVFFTLNHFLLSNNYDPGTSGLISAGTASTTFFFTMCAMYDRMQLLTKKTNKKIKSAIQSLKNRFSKEDIP